MTCVSCILHPQELASRGSVLMDLNEDSENEEEDFDNWVPDPVDADPSKLLTVLCSMCTTHIDTCAWTHTRTHARTHIQTHKKTGTLFKLCCTHTYVYRII